MAEPIVIYTNQLKKRMPEEGYNGWNDERDVCDQIDDVVMGVILTKNRVISGGEVTIDSDLNVNYTAIVVEIAGVVYRIDAGALTLTEATTTPEQVNWVYVDDTGAIVDATDPPSGDYVPLALADTSDVAILRIADLRPFAAPVEGVVENDCINGNDTINQRVFDGNWAGISIGAYGYDRWRRGVAANTVEQPVINTTIHGGFYVLSWEGGGTGEIQQSSSTVISGTSPLIATLADQTEAILVVPEDATDKKFYASDKVLPVGRRTKEEELKVCQPYCWKGTLPGNGLGYYYVGAILQNMLAGAVSFPVTMIGTPSISIITAPSYANCTHVDLVPSANGFEHRTNAVASGRYRAANGVYLAEKEL